jgi:transcriptional regulator with XRE-family HTH domain
MSYIGKNIRKIRTIKKLSQSDFAKIFNLARPSVGAYEEERAEPKIETLVQIAHYFGLSVDALLTKELTINELYKFDIFSVKPENNLKNKDEVAEETPLVYANNELEYIVNLHNKDFINNLPSIHLPNIKEAKSRAFEVEGAEMEYNNSGLHNGDILLCIPADKTIEKNLHSGKIYVVVTSKKIWVRRLQNKQDGLEFVSDNPSYGKITVKNEDLLELWEAVAVYSTYLQPPTRIEERVSQLEKDYSDLLDKIKRIEKKL